MGSWSWISLRPEREKTDALVTGTIGQCRFSASLATMGDAVHDLVPKAWHSNME